MIDRILDPSLESSKVILKGVEDKVCVNLEKQAYAVYLLGQEYMCDVSMYSKVLIITNKTIAPLYLESLQANLKAKEVYECIIEDGEEFKTWESVSAILDSAFCYKLDRKSLMIALGGGVISDLVGFASGIYQRGIDFINFPTTLLAQVDASVGGKCGINNAFGKNLVGLFHQPVAVCLWMDFLSSLPRREYQAGIAEIIKIAACLDAEFFHRLEELDLNNPEALTPCILKSIELKARVVVQDEKEKNLRALLNYGHTFAHVIELLGNYRQYLHGEAVAIGMRMANALGRKLGITSLEASQRVERLLEKNGLNFDYRIDCVQEFCRHFFTDKKTEFGNLRVVLVSQIGSAGIFSHIGEEQVMEVLKEWL